MRFTDINYVLQILMHKLKNIIFLFFLFCNNHVTNGIFQPGKEYIYSYNALSSSGVLLPSGASSSWGFNGKLKIQAEQNVATMQLESLKMTIWNGKIQDQGEDQAVSEDVTDLLKPFQIIYRNGLIENFSTEAISPWSVNIKRSIAGILQLDLSNLEKETAFHSTEKNHYGQCNIEYVVNPEEENEWIIRKFFDPRACIGHPHYTWSNVPNMLCPNGDQNPILKSSERLYKIKMNGSLNEILFVNASGGIYVQSFQSFGEAHFHFTRQIFKLISVKDTVDKIPIKDLYFKVLQHELPEVDLTQSRGTLDKNTVFKSIGTLLDRLSLRLENPGLDTEADNLHNTTITVLLYYLQMLDVADLRNAYTKISGTSYKEETIRNMFLEALPQVGTKEAALFILELIQDRKVSDMSAIQLLTQLPFHIRKPDVQLLVNLQTFLNLPEKISVEVQNTAILTYGTLIYKTCLLYCPYEMLDDYVRLYLDKFTETKEYEKKMIWLEGLANIQLGRVVEFLEPIASGSNAESRHFRVLAAWASLSTAPLRPDVIYPVYWPILINRTEHLEMRVAALTLLVVSSPTPSRLISLYWYMQSEPNQHLYNYFYTILKSMERTTHPCYIHIGVIAAQFTRVLRPTTNSYLITGNYLFDYQDTYRKFGAMIHGIVIANPLTNIPEVLYVTVNTYGSGVSINHVSLYIKAEGLLHSLSAHLDGPTQVKDILKQFKLDEKQNGPVHLEVIARIQEKTVLCLHLNETNIIKGFKYLSSLPDNIYHIYQNMEFHVNQQRINIPLTMESVQVTDLGANARLAVIATSLFSMRGNFTHVSVGRNNHVILRTSIHKSEIIENYNPLIDTWHSAERAHSIHGYLPVNITLGFKDRPFISYNTPGEHLKMGITAHVRTSTNIKGLNIKSKLRQICPTCPQLYIITKSPTYKPKTIDLFQFELSELGGQVYVKLFDCENVISREKLIQDVFSSHRANYPIWPFLEFALTALHFLDYYTYVPPKGSCGLAAYISTIDAQRTQVKFEYIKGSNHHMLSLTHYNIESSQILQQWNVAALYEITSWISDTIKIKATKVIPGQKILKFCLEAEKAIPWEWDFLSTKPSDPARITLNAVWGYSDAAKGKCDGSSITLDLLGEISEKQLQIAKESQWPYEECREQSKRKRFTPFSDACYEVSRELSTLRKYQVVAQHENIPQNLMRLAWKFRAFYDLIGGNSSSDPNSKKFIVTATFPKGSDIGELSLNNDKVAIEYNYNLIDYFLTRTRIHKYMDLSILKTFFGTCVVTPDYIKSIHNITYPFHNKGEVLLLGQCYSENPKYALTARNDLYGININIYDEIDTVRIIPNQTGGTLYNNTIYIPLPQSFMFHSLGSKRVRLDSNTIDIIIPNLYLYMHWTQEQILLFFPTYLLEFTCGICALGTLDSNNLYEKL
ncbi:vitellogenin-4 isoform X1 [Bombus vancouverensis nearcticus]|uniref:Vitellogenin-4-like isoform X1 n=1 Tax=Bombus bifarius TaxID=103933 RepID=A0A6P8NAK4_9HYME|nr:vitellogenin-4-like isoform X1 [Bombus vancouverensis nearcticus]XP_033317349.1 vitellogenin-4-like isoform X1 [Bombus bifarius]